MLWSQAIAGMGAVETAGRPDVQVSGVQYDSRRVRPGDVFVAMQGGVTDGNSYIDAAIEKGAVGIVTDSPEVFAGLRVRQPELALARVDRSANSGRRALSKLSSAVFGAPEKRLRISAVTGTNGKTTTAFLLEQMLSWARRSCILLGTIETHLAGRVRASEHTTPESRDLLAVFAEGVEAGCSEAVMEMSSHALAQERVWGIPVDVAIFTNLTQDHLDYHGTMEKYRRAKQRLFEGVGAAPPRVAVINAEDAAAEQMLAAAAGCQRMTYGIERGDWRAEDLVLDAGRMRFRLRAPEGAVAVEAPLTGRVNVFNLLAASCAAHARGLALEEIAAAARRLRPAPGRFEVVSGCQDAGFLVVVDYAHTEDALANLIALARDLVRERDGRVITMFGCGGDRDRGKRPRMGRVAAQGSEVVVVTSDNPRSEDPERIIEEILPGVREAQAESVSRDPAECLVEVDRRAAIARAIDAARPGDVVLLAGKGHEKTQTFAHGVVAFDDVAEAEAVLRALRLGAKEG